ncbi:MAG: transposase [Planctomycetota bacterium]|jgi:REP element-mobilizing transposase RayT
MARRLRHIHEPNTLVEVTTRTTQGRMLLRPSKQVNEIIIGIVGRAQRLYKTRIHGISFMSNHAHMLVSADEANEVSSFMRFVNGNISEEIGRIHDWPNALWARRYQDIQVSKEPGAQRQRLEYLLRHGSKENLVERPQDWPGVHSANALRFRGELHGYWFDRTQERAAKRRGEKFSRYKYATKETITFTPIPTMQEMAPKEYKAIIRDIVNEASRDAAAERARRGVNALGVKAILAQDPHTRPARVKRSYAPDFHTVSKQARMEMRQAYNHFLAEHRRATRNIWEGERNIGGFPGGCFPAPLPYVTHLKGYDAFEAAVRRHEKSKEGKDPPPEEFATFTITV